MDSWWDVKELDQFFYKVLSVSLEGKVARFLNFIQETKARMFNLQRHSRVYNVGTKHYDIGNDFYEKMLDKRMIYSCGYWKEASTLKEAQEAKLDLICRKLDLKKGQTILDIGSGWGGFLKYAVQKYEVRGVGITISKEQKKLSEENTKGLDIEIRLEDFRNLEGTYDRIVSIGMFEHVGYKNYDEFMKQIESALRDDGLLLLHTIGSNTTERMGDPWSDKYIFPNGMLPSVAQIGKSIEGKFIMEDWHNFGADYDKTLMSWWNNFSKSMSELGGKKYDERFTRMWKYYLLSFAGSFRARKLQLWQIVLSKKGVRGGYNSIR